MAKPPHLTMDPHKLLALAEIVDPIRSEIMTEIMDRLKPADPDEAVTFYTLALGLMLGDATRAMLPYTGEIEGAINDLWKHSHWPMRMRISGGMQ